MSGRLFLVGTPIGNLGDLSPRAAEILAEADFIAAEDTRVTVKLLNHLGIKKPMVSYFEHNRAASGEKILERLKAGETCALVTDAGMPAISDPGEDLVAQCAEAGIEIAAVPGPSAVVTALALSGLPTGRFTFEGFLSTAKRSRFEHLEELRDEKRTMVFYEAPHKLLLTLKDMLAVWGDRRIALCREMTKLHEETVRTTLAEAAAVYEAEPPRGEFVLVIEGVTETREEAYSLSDAAELVERYRLEGMSLKDAVKKASAVTGLARNAVYDAAVKQDQSKD